MLLNATQAQFNDLLERLDESLDLYRDMRAQLPESSRRVQLDKMLIQRAHLQEQLHQAAVKELEMRPRAADQDIEGLTHLVEQLRSLWQKKEDVVLDLLQDHEQELQQAYQALLAQGKEQFSADLQLLLAELKEHLQATQDWLLH